jgi:biopolymer transport protein ExbB
MFAVAMLPMIAMAQAPDATEPAQVSRGFFSIVFSGGVTGIAIMIVLIALSVLAAWLIIDHLLTVRHADIMPEGLSEQTRQLLAKGQVDQAFELCNKNPSVLAFVLLHGIAEIEFGWTAVEKAVEDALAEQSARLYRKIEYLSVLGNIAPMVGLLGTVVGMIMAFQEVAASQATAGAPQLAEGIYQALVTTVGGLIVAIPSIAAFAIFRNRVDQLVAETGYTVQHVFGPLRRKRK